jgi:hypothetical protein
LRAYSQTVSLVIFRTKLFCRAVYRPVSYSDAQRFRWASILQAYVPLLVTLAVLQLVHPDILPWAADETGWWFVILVCACPLLALLVLTGLPSYFYHPRHLSIEQQNRAVAISYYGCAALTLTLPAMTGFCTATMIAWAGSEHVALLGLTALCLFIVMLIGWLTSVRFGWLVPLYPLAWTAAVALVLIILCAVWAALRQPLRGLEYALGVPFAVAPLGLVLLCWLDLIAIARRTLRRPLATLRMALLMPMLSLLAGGLALIGLPAVAYFLALAFYGLVGSGLGG